MESRGGARGAGRRDKIFYLYDKFTSEPEVQPMRPFGEKLLLSVDKPSFNTLKDLQMLLIFHHCTLYNFQNKACSQFARNKLGASWIKTQIRILLENSLR